MLIFGIAMAVIYTCMAWQDAQIYLMWHEYDDGERLLGRITTAVYILLTLKYWIG